jgi:ubiquinone/menaquinone biosynthesis C-methylase UbiE
MMKRRTVLAATGSLAGASAIPAAFAADKPFVDRRIEPWNQPDDIKAKHFRKFPKQDEESRQDFTRGMSSFLGTTNGPQARQQLVDHVKSKGHGLLDDTDLTPEQAFNLLCEDPTYAARTRLGRSNFHLHWDNPRRAFFRDAEYFLAEMEKTDNAGPGKLILNPALDMPNSARHEIHTMPGGYVGCPFGGWTYDLGHVAGTDSLKDHGRSHGYAQTMPLPKDGKVKRVLDIGCGMGESTNAVKERFPNTEVWGIDVGGPMVRYAHYQAVRQNLDITFAQLDAADTKLPENHFDLVGSCIIFHEIDPVEAKKVVKEIFRVLRPGGIYHHVDIPTIGTGWKPSNTLTAKAGEWSTYRHNVETWWAAFQKTDFPAVLKEAGFELDFTGKRNGMSKENNNGFPAVAAIKPA